MTCPECGVARRDAFALTAHLAVVHRLERKNGSAKYRPIAPFDQWTEWKISEQGYNR